MTKQNYFLTNSIDFIKWVKKDPSHHFKKKHVVSTNLENYDKNLKINPLLNNFEAMLTLQDVGPKNEHVFKFLKRYSDFQMCNSWKINLNIFSLLEHEFVRIYDFSHVPYIIYSKRRQIFLPKCSPITEIAILNEEKHHADENLCSKDLPIIYMVDEKLFQGYMNTQNIIHSRSNLVPCVQIDQLYIIRFKNPKFESVKFATNESEILVFYLVRVGKSITINKKHVQYYDEIDPFNYDRNHFNYKYDVKKHVGMNFLSFDADNFLNFFGSENLITNHQDKNISKNISSDSKLSNYNNEIDFNTLCLYAFITNIATSVLIFMAFETLKNNNAQNQIRFHQHLRLKYLQLKKFR